MTTPEDERPPGRRESAGDGGEHPPDDAPEAPGGDQPTEEQFAIEAGLTPPTDEHFDGIPPEKLPPEGPLPESGEFAALEPEFADALRAAGAKPEQEPGAEVQSPEDPDATVEYAPGESPEEEGTAEQLVKTEGGGAGAPPAAAAPLPPGPQGKPPPDGDHEPPPKPKRYWWRFSLASVIIVAVAAAATCSSVLLYIDAFASKLEKSSIKGVDRVLNKVPDGGPENFLILGSDKRATTPGDPGRSDTTILLRIDPDRGAIALMSIPRDLKVNIPGYGVDKFNAAYTYGGPKLAVRLVKQLTGLRINHLVNVDFLGFVKAVDAIGCVWADVDRRYYHSNVGLAASEQYSEINIKAGYQRLCGKDALAYARYRHTDTDLVRAARQQDFLREARQRVPLGTLISDRTKLLKIFTAYTSSDIDNVGTALEVLKALFEARGAAIKEVHFPAVLGPSYVYASKSAIRKAVNQFLGIEASGGPRGSLEAPKAGSRRPKPKKIKVKSPGDDGLVPYAETGRQKAKAVARQVGPGFEVFYPTRLPSSAIYVENSSTDHVQNPRVYHLRDTGGDLHSAYRLTLQLLPLGDYFGVQGIRGWSDPPILSGSSVRQEIQGRDYDIYLDGDRVRLVAWHEGEDTYWIANSLLQTLSNDQMIGIARSVDSITPNPKKHGKTKRKKKGN